MSPPFEGRVSIDNIVLVVGIIVGYAFEVERVGYFISSTK
jgi:hypothetical protein